MNQRPSSVILITGVSSGIGNGLAEHYLRRGDTVLGISRRQPENLTSDRFHFESIDLCDEQAVRQQLAKLLHHHPLIDTVVLNAGVLGRIADMAETSLSELKQTMDINVWSCKTVLDVAIDRCEQINKVVTMSSGAAVNGNRGWNGYSISKAALNMLTMLYASENPDVHFAAVAPGLVDTAMQDYLCGSDSDPRFPSLENLKVRRGTAEMPGPEQAAKKLIALFDNLQQHVESGGFVDIRNVPELDVT